MIHENNENFVSVFNVFLKLMIKVENSAFVNLSNFWNDELKEIMNYDLMFYATSRFTKAFVEGFVKTYPSIKTINVIVDYNKLKEKEEWDALCEKTFSNLGVNQEISA